MKKAQFVSPLIILAIIIISTIITLINYDIREELLTKTANQLSILNSITESNQAELEYQNQLTKTVLQLLSTINSSGTITSILGYENNTEIGFNNEISLKYAFNYEEQGCSRVINNTIIVPYPYNKFLNQETRLDTENLGTCMGTNNCNNFESCINSYDSGTIDWQPIICLTSPLRVKISIKDAEYPLTTDYPYIIFNNSYIMLG
ncbi:MAG: hypothetical protein JW791_00270 [Nanoarchaeota archaeon]|nr:hypothetical protein [Nanoarchaeota archaeon]